MLGLVSRLLQQRHPHGGHARGDEQREQCSRERERRHDPEDPPREAPQSDPPRSERDDLTVTVEAPETDEHREVERERQERRKLLDELQGENLTINSAIPPRPPHRRGCGRTDPPVDQDEDGEYRGARAQHFTAEVALDDQDGSVPCRRLRGSRAGSGDGGRDPDAAWPARMDSFPALSLHCR